MQTRGRPERTRSHRPPSPTAFPGRLSRHLTITDHSPAAAYAGSLSVERLRRQWEEIARVEQLDIVIASVHNRYRMDADQMTRRIVTAAGASTWRGAAGWRGVRS